MTRATRPSGGCAGRSGGRRLRPITSGRPAAAVHKERPVRRSSLPIVSALSALTAVALLAAALAVRPPGVPAGSGGPREAAKRALVRRFYAAANRVIAEGDPDPLAAVAAPALLTDPAGAAPGRGTLAR